MLKDMIRNNIFKRILSVGMLCTCMVGCTDLEPKLTDSVLVETEEGTFQGDPAELLNSIYRQMQHFTAQENVFALMEHSSDELIGPTRGTDWGDNGIWRLLHNHLWDQTHLFILNAWNDMHGASFTANQVLASNPTPIQAAEAKFLRAFHMFLLLDLYGQVPFREVDEGVDVDPEVFTRIRAWEFAMQDLEEALPDLPDGGPGVTPERPNKSSAQMLMAKLFLNKAVYVTPVTEEGVGAFNFEATDMDQVIQLADAIAAAGYTLEPDYFSNFGTAGSSEILFTTQTDIGSAESRFRMTMHYNHPFSGGWNGFATLADFYALFEEDDLRKGGTPDRGLGFGFLVGQQYDTAGNALRDRPGNPLVFTPDITLAGNNERTGIRVIKYHPSDFQNLVFFRYADVYLMKIEAILRGGTASGESAQDILDNLRSVRGVGSVPATLDEILDERGRELYWEGWRRQDQIRFGTFGNTWVEKENTEPFRVLYPIPQQAVDSNPNLVQNPGY